MESAAGPCRSKSLLKILFNNEATSDLTLKVAGSTFFVHKCIMTVTSEMVKAQLVFPCTDHSGCGTNAEAVPIGDTEAIPFKQSINIAVPKVDGIYGLTMHDRIRSSNVVLRCDAIFELYLKTAYTLISPNSYPDLRQLFAVAIVADYMLSKDIVALCDDAIVKRISFKSYYDRKLALTLTRRHSLWKTHKVVLESINHKIVHKSLSLSGLGENDLKILINRTETDLLNRFRILILYVSGLHQTCIADMHDNKLKPYRIKSVAMRELICYGYDLLIPCLKDISEFQVVSEITTSLQFDKSLGFEAAWKVHNAVLKRYNDIANNGLSRIIGDWGF